MRRERPVSDPQPERQGHRLRETARFQNDLAELALQANLEGLHRRVIEGVRSLLDSELAILVLTEERNPGWLAYKTLDEQSGWVFHLQPDEGCGPVSDCLRSGNVISLEGSSAQINFDPSCTGEDLVQARSLIAAPLKASGQTLGAVLAVNCSQDYYSPLDEDLISVLASATASAIQTARLIQEHRVSRADLEAGGWELLESRNFLRTLFDHLPVSLYIIDSDYQLIVVNKNRAEQLPTPVSADALSGQICFQALFNRDKPCIGCRAHETLAQSRVTQREERRSNNRAEISDWEISSYPILNDQGAVSQVMLFEQNATEKRRLEAILIQSEKLAAVGQLAAGVAHEINNPLTAIIANAQILQRELPAGSDLQESVDLIARAGARAAQVVRNLLDFARKEEYRLRPTDINLTVEHALELVQHELLAHGIQLRLDLDPRLPTLLASPDHLQSVWLNLILNAVDSLDGMPGWISISTHKKQDELQIAVTDNGKGIPAEHLSRIFEPFYTTKSPGRGTGLGLSVSNRIVKQHGGHILLKSQPGQGSAFIVILPAP